MVQLLGCKAGVFTTCLHAFAAAAWHRCPHPSGLLHEEAPVVCDKEQENSLQASKIERIQDATARVKGRPERV